MGTRLEFGDVITETTGIHREALNGEDPKMFSISQRMSWASQRKTTRVEDLAYCLMGLFGVNMPLLYGEKQRAFLRLQEEIMKISEDHSLFAWEPPLHRILYSGLLASTPAHFSKSGNILPFSHPRGREIEDQAPYSMTNKGISISLPLAAYEDPPNTFFAILDCQDATDARGPLTISLVRNDRGYYSRIHQHHRLLPAGALNRPAGSFRKHMRNIYVKQYEVALRVRETPEYQFHLPQRHECLSQYQHCVLEGLPNDLTAIWNSQTMILGCSQGLGAAIRIDGGQAHDQFLLVGIDSQLQARCTFVDGSVIYFKPRRGELPMLEKLRSKWNGCDKNSKWKNSTVLGMLERGS